MQSPKKQLQKTKQNKTKPKFLFIISAPAHHNSSKTES